MLSKAKCAHLQDRLAGSSFNSFADTDNSTSVFLCICLSRYRFKENTYHICKILSVQQQQYCDWKSKTRTSLAYKVDTATVLTH